MAVALPSQLLLSFQGVGTSLAGTNVSIGLQNTALATSQSAVDSYTPPTPELQPREVRSPKHDESMPTKPTILLGTLHGVKEDGSHGSPYFKMLEAHKRSGGLEYAAAEVMGEKDTWDILQGTGNMVQPSRGHASHHTHADCNQDHPPFVRDCDPAIDISYEDHLGLLTPGARTQTVTTFIDGIEFLTTYKWFNDKVSRSVTIADGRKIKSVITIFLRMGPADVFPLSHVRIVIPTVELESLQEGREIDVRLDVNFRRNVINNKRGRVLLKPVFNDKGRLVKFVGSVTSFGSFKAEYDTSENRALIIEKPVFEIPIEAVTDIGAVVPYAPTTHDGAKPGPQLPKSPGYGGSSQGTAGRPYIPRRSEGPTTDAEYLGGDFGAATRARQQASAAKITGTDGREFHAGAPNGTTGNGSGGSSGSDAGAPSAMNIRVSKEGDLSLDGRDPRVNVLSKGNGDGVTEMSFTVKAADGSIASKFSVSKVGEDRNYSLKITFGTVTVRTARGNEAKWENGDKTLLLPGEVIIVAGIEIPFNPRPAPAKAKSIGQADTPPVDDDEEPTVEMATVSRTDRDIPGELITTDPINGENALDFARSDKIIYGYLHFRKDGDAVFVMADESAAAEGLEVKLNGTAIEPGKRWYPFNPGDNVSINPRPVAREKVDEALCQPNVVFNLQKELQKEATVTYRQRHPLTDRLRLLPDQKRHLVLRAIRGAKSIEELQDRLRGTGIDAAGELNDALAVVLNGGASVTAGLPSVLGVREKVAELMASDMERIHRAVPWSGNTQLKSYKPGISKEHAKYVEAKASRDFYDAVQRTRSLEELVTVVEKCPIDVVQGINFNSLAGTLRGFANVTNNGLRNLPTAFGIRQKVCDLLERRSHELHAADPEYGRRRTTPLDPALRGDFERLDKMLEDIFKPSSGWVKGRSKAYTPTELEEAIYQVLERFQRPVSFITTAGGIRDRALEYMRETIKTANRLFPQEMEWPSLHDWKNPYSGDPIREGDIESNYRYAKMVLNGHAGRPIFGYPTVSERQAVVGIATRYFPNGMVLSYADAQRTIRRHIEGETKELEGFMRNALPPEKALVLEAYFGNYHHRQFIDVQKAARIARFLGEMGNYREVGVTINKEYGVLTANLSLGDMRSVAGEEGLDFYIMHSHPEEYRADDDHVMGSGGDLSAGGVYTVAMDLERISGDTRNVLFSRQDLRVFTAEARRYNGMRYLSDAKEEPWYSPKKGIYTTWLDHRFGMARMDVIMTNRGEIDHVDVKFGVKSTREVGISLDRNYISSIEKLQKEARRLGVNIIFGQVSYEEISSEYPY